MEVFTIGHSNHGAQGFVGLLQQHKIDILIDVRSKPRSRLPHFNGPALALLVRANKIGYLYGGLALGGFSPYGPKHALFVDKMDKIIGMAKEGQRVAMMCSEGKPCECHRAGKLTAWIHRVRPAVKTTHILPTGALVDARDYEPTVLKSVQWPEFQPWVPDLFSPKA